MPHSIDRTDAILEKKWNSAERPKSQLFQASIDTFDHRGGAYNQRVAPFAHVALPAPWLIGRLQWSRSDVPAQWIGASSSAFAGLSQLVWVSRGQSRRRLSLPASKSSGTWARHIGKRPPRESAYA